MQWLQLAHLVHFRAEFRDVRVQVLEVFVQFRLAVTRRFRHLGSERWEADSSRSRTAFAATDEVL